MGENDNKEYFYKKKRKKILSEGFIMSLFKNKIFRIN